MEKGKTGVEKLIFSKSFAKHAWIIYVISPCWPLLSKIKKQEQSPVPNTWETVKIMGKESS